MQEEQIDKAMSDTPRTDDQSVRYYDDATGTRIEYVAARFARQLERELTQRERELAEAREETIRTREFMGRGFAKAKEELATMETRHAATMMHTQSVVDDANQLREQRDRLAEAALFLADLAEKNTDDGDLWKSAFDKVRTLAAVKGAKP